MPIKIVDSLPAARTLESENVFIITENRALRQDIRPLKIAILNLMPKKIETETQLLRLLGNTPLQVEIELLQTASHISKNTPSEHLLKFYKVFDDIKDEKFDGLIITGAPVEQIDFSQVDYWEELCQYIEWAKTNVYSTFYICWAAQAGLFYNHGINKYPLSEKLSGIFVHSLTTSLHPLVRGFDDKFWVPHSRYTEIRYEDVKSIPELDILATSDKAGIYIVADRDCRNIYVTGHSEYSLMTLANEYSRDTLKGLNPKVPENYFPQNDPHRRPILKWKSHANLLFSNWLNHIVYQHTPYDLSSL